MCIYNTPLDLKVAWMFMQKSWCHVEKSVQRSTGTSQTVVCWQCCGSTMCFIVWTF